MLRPDHAKRSRRLLWLVGLWVGGRRGGCFCRLSYTIVSLMKKAPRGRCPKDERREDQSEGAEGNLMMLQITKSVLTLFAGAVIALVLVAAAAPKILIEEIPSPFDIDQTTERLEQAAEAEGWKVSGVRKLDESVLKNGGPALRPVRLLEICEPNYAGALLDGDAQRMLSVLMPCTISIYEKSDGRVYVSRLNVSLLGKLFGGEADEILSGRVAADQDAIIRSVRAATQS